MAVLQIIEQKEAIASAQRKLEQVLRKALRSQGTRKIGYPGGNADQTVYAAGEGKLYCAFAPPNPKGQGIPRYWNSFGIFRPIAAAQEIVVEINVPDVGDDARVSGLFARNPASGDIYLMHDGGIGGGRKGIGKAAFLQSIPDRLVDVQGSQRVRQAMMIANLSDPGLPALLWRFVLKVDGFKRSQVGQQSSASEPRSGEKDYKSEFSGRKQGVRAGEFDYVTYHGMVVDELKRQRDLSLGDGEKTNRDRLVDLYVAKNGKRIEIYEVKSSPDRQSVYTGIGQLMTHATERTTKRILVVPSSRALPKDCAAALDRLGIEVRKFRLVGAGTEVTVKLL